MFQICDIENLGKEHDVQHSQVATFDGKYMISYLITIVMFPLSLTICEMFAKQEKAKTLTLKMRSMSTTIKRDLRHSTEMFDFI